MSRNEGDLLDGWVGGCGWVWVGVGRFIGIGGDMANVVTACCFLG